MAVTFQIPRVLRRYCGGIEEFPLEGRTIRDLLVSLNGKYPDLYLCVCDETGAVRRHVNLFINNDFIRDREGLDTRVESSDVVSVFQAVSGG